MSSQPSSSMSTIPSTPTMVRQQYQQSQDPFSSPARGVGWSPSASIPLLDVLFRGEEDSTPSGDAQSASDLGEFRASRVVWPVPNSRDEDASALVSPLKNASASSSQSRQAPPPEDMTRFLVSPRSGPPSSPSSSRFPETSHSTTHSLCTHSSPVASASQSPSARITWYAGGLDDDRQDQYQWASPASGGLGYPNYYPTFHSSYLETYSPSSQAYLSPSQVFLSPSASFLSPSRAFISPSAAFPSPSLMHASSVRSSSPFFPPPASPPPFAMHLASGAHTSSNSGDVRTPESTHDDSDSSQMMNAPPSSPVIPPSSLVLPPSSPVLSPPSSAPLMDDPFLVSRKTHVYTRVPRPTRGKTGLVDVQAGITKPPRAKAKAATRDRRVIPSLERSAPGESSSLSSLGEAPDAMSRGQAASAVPTPAKFATAARGSLQPPLTIPGSLSAPRVTSTATYSENVCANPSTSFTPSFSTPASNTSFMFPTPTSTIALATPAHPGLLSSPEIVDPFSTPGTSSDITRRRGRGKERVKRAREVRRDGTPTPVGASGDIWNTGREDGVEVDPKREVDSMGVSGVDDENSGGAQGSHLTSEQLAVSILNEEPARPKAWIVPKNERVVGSLSSEDSLGLRESVKAATGPSGQAGFASAAVSKDGPGVASPQDSSSSIKRGKRVLDEDGDEYDPVKKIKTDEESVSRDRVGNRVRRNARAPHFPVARPTRSHARAVAALLVPEASTDLDALDHKIYPSFVDAGQAESSAAPSLAPPHTQPTITYTQLEAPNSKRIREKRPGTADRVVLGRAPSRATSEVQASKPHQRSVGLKLEGGSAIQRTRPIDMGNEDDEEDATQGDDEAEGETQTEAEGSYSPKPSPTKSKHQIPSDLLPRPDASLIYASDKKLLRRTFPKRFPIHEGYPGLYRRFPVSAYFLRNDPAREFVLGKHAAKDKSAFPPAPGPGSLVPNAAQHFNLYTPRFVRGVGAGKVGLCAICVEPVWRGGEGKSALFNTKISAYNYHMQYNHGISSRTGLPFSPPIRFRKTKRPVSHVKPLERAKIEEGKCHACQKWVAIESVKTAEVLVPELYWWKHAASCHSVNHFAGDKDPYFEDHVYLRLREYEASIRGDPKLEDAPNSSDSADNAFKPSASKCSGLNAESQPASQLDETLNPKGLSLGSGSLAPFVQTTSLSESVNGPGRFFFMDSDSDLTDLEEDENGEIVDMDISEGENM